MDCWMRRQCLNSGQCSVGKKEYILKNSFGPITVLGSKLFSKKMGEKTANIYHVLLFWVTCSLLIFKHENTGKRRLSPIQRSPRRTTNVLQCANFKIPTILNYLSNHIRLQKSPEKRSIFHFEHKITAPNPCGIRGLPFPCKFIHSYSNHQISISISSLLVIEVQLAGTSLQHKL